MKNNEIRLSEEALAILAPESAAAPKAKRNSKGNYTRMAA